MKKLTEQNICEKENELMRRLYCLPTNQNEVMRKLFYLPTNQNQAKRKLFCLPTNQNEVMRKLFWLPTNQNKVMSRLLCPPTNQNDQGTTASIFWFQVTTLEFYFSYLSFSKLPEIPSCSTKAAVCRLKLVGRLLSAAFPCCFYSAAAKKKKTTTM